MNATKEQITTLLNAWINQRAGLEFGNYGDRASYMQEARRISKQGKDARALLRAVQLSSITAEELTEAFRAFSGRLRLTETKDGKYRLDYCTGQYWPTEYRAAACAVLTSALWDYHRADTTDGNDLRAKLRRIYGRGIASRWMK